MEEKALQFLLRYSEWIKDAGFLNSLWHSFVMSVIRVSYQVAKFSEGIVDEIFKITGFLEEGTIGTIYSSMRILASSVLAVTIIYLLYKYIFDDQVNLKGSILRTVIFLSLIIHLPGLMNSGMEVTKAMFDSSKDLYSEGASLSYSIVRNNTIDLNYLSRNGFELLDDPDGNTQKMNLSEAGFLNTDLSQIILPSDINEMKKNAANEENTESLSYRLQSSDDGKLKAEKIKNGRFSAFDNGKFRFKADVPAILISLWTMTIVYLLSSFTIGVAIVELVFARILFPILAAMDIESGQKVKRILEDIGNTFCTIMLTGLTMSIFSAYFSYLSTLNLNILAYVILCFVGMTMVISGPKTFGKYLGIDTGVKNGFKSLIGGYYGAKAAMGIGGAAADLAISAVQAPSKIVNGVTSSVKKDMANVQGISDKVGQVKDNANDYLDAQINDIFDRPPGAYTEEVPLKNKSNIQEKGSENESIDNNVIDQSLEAEAQSNEIQEKSANSINAEPIDKENSVQLGETKSVADSGITEGEEDSGTNRIQEAQNEEIDPNRKVNVQNSRLDDSPKTVDVADNKLTNLEKLDNTSSDPSKLKKGVNENGEFSNSLKNESLEETLENKQQVPVPERLFVNTNDSSETDKVNLQNDTPKKQESNKEVSNRPESTSQTSANKVPIVSWNDQFPNVENKSPDTVKDSKGSQIRETGTENPSVKEPTEGTNSFENANEKLNTLNAEDYFPKNNTNTSERDDK